MAIREGKPRALSTREQDIWMAGYRSGFIAHARDVQASASDAIIRAGARSLFMAVPEAWPRRTPVIKTQPRGRHG